MVVYIAKHWLANKTEHSRQKMSPVFYQPTQKVRYSDNNYEMVRKSLNTRSDCWFYAEWKKYGME